MSSSCGEPLIVLVDARNVLRSRWPNLGEAEVVERTCAWAERHGFEAIVVFDGQAPEVGAATRGISPHCTVVGTGGESADDWLTRKAADLGAARQRFWLVTSDRALRAAAGSAAERTIGGGSFVRTLTSPAVSREEPG